MTGIVMPIAAAFLVTLLVTPVFIRFLKANSITGVDQQKRRKTVVAEMGGLPVLTGFLAGAFSFIAIRVFMNNVAAPSEIFAAALTLIIIVMIGILDDITNISRKAGDVKRKGIKQTQKFLLPLFAAVPLMAINSGVSTMVIPFVGSVDMGLLYPLLIIPLGILGAANATNMLAGLNGLEASLGAVLLSSLGIFAYSNGAVTAAVIAFVFAASLAAFLVYNAYPAKIFPGDSMTYAIGAAAASVAILANIEMFAVACFALWFIEFLLKARSGLKAESFGKLQKDGSLKAPYKRTYSLTHAVMKIGKFNEKEIVMILLALQVLVCMVAFSVLS